MATDSGHSCKRSLALAFLVVTAPTGALSQQPMSVIDWLQDNPADSVVLRPGEPPVSNDARIPEVAVRPLDAAPAAVGLVPSSVTGFPETLWRGAKTETLTRLIEEAPTTGHPALQALLYSLLLTEALPADDPARAEALLLARVDKLLEMGAIDPAQALMDQAGPMRSPAIFERWAHTAFLLGNEDQACRMLAEARHLSPGYELSIFCTARAGDLSAATVQFDAAIALSLLPPEIEAPLDRFLHPELFDGADTLPIPRNPSPLMFRLYEAVGENLPTASLPRAFAVADLRDIAGWKAQLDAAERLARTGALTPNTLLGLYTDRLPAASGGVWDRVAALQRFETALGTRSSDAVAKTLPAVWSQMRAVGLDVVFADLFAADLSRIALPEGPAARLARRVALISADYETLARGLTPADETEAFWLALAAGEPARTAPVSEVSAAVAAGFGAGTELPRSLSRDRLGEAVLRAMVLFDRGARGNLADLTDALIILRALGLEETARRASLQLLVRLETET